MEEVVDALRTEACGVEQRQRGLQRGQQQEETHCAHDGRLLELEGVALVESLQLRRLEPGPRPQAVQQRPSTGRLHRVIHSHLLLSAAGLILRPLQTTKIVNR